MVRVKGNHKNLKKGNNNLSKDHVYGTSYKTVYGSSHRDVEVPRKRHGDKREVTRLDTKDRRNQTGPRVEVVRLSPSDVESNN